jgi:phosphatidylserine decarboxylase
MKLHKEGWIYCIVASALFAIFIAGIDAALGNYPVIFYLLLLPAGFLWFWVFWFFRIPSRVKTTGDSLVISPCDGKVVVIEETTETEYFKDKRIQVSIFMSPLNVHVNCYPINGVVQYVKYHKGKFLVAWHPKSSTDNERWSVVIENDKGSILLKQIAGALARRICNYAAVGTKFDQTAEYGFIKFGSRVDLLLPLDAKINCKIGDVVKGGITVLANW